MPELDVWETFFNPQRILAALGFTPEHSQVVEFGCGYGTFTIPAALILATKTSQSNPDQLGPDQSDADQSGPGQSDPGQSDPDQSGANPSNIAQGGRVAGKLTAFDIDPKMIEITQSRARLANVDNIEALAVDFDRARAPLNSRSVDYVMLFNILHGENPFALLVEAYRLLKPGAAGGLIHWNYDPETPRGPPMEIRPQPAKLAKLTSDAGFRISPEIDLPPYHYGFRFEKPALG